MSHKSMHSNVNQFNCNFKDCKKSYKYRSSLFKHKIRSHSPRCNKC